MRGEVWKDAAGSWSEPATHTYQDIHARTHTHVFNRLCRISPSTRYTYTHTCTDMCKLYQVSPYPVLGGCLYEGGAPIRGPAIEGGTPIKTDSNAPGEL
jgi:hypothetical protein